ncbi:hypothetical protein [Aestuariibius sp. HNIBRBA575]|uniref:hypothetical protein n=1 Tax=Aestuariibius sp. HNIBRBA575 TaxID=3233343 RepID=UPI0034A49EBE
MVEFTDRESVERWLEERPQRVAIALAYRAALRVAPEHLQFRDELDELSFSENARLSVLRAILISQVAAISRRKSEYLAKAARNAAHNAYVVKATVAAYSSATTATSDVAQASELSTYFIDFAEGPLELEAYISDATFLAGQDVTMAESRVASLLNKPVYLNEQKKNDRVLLQSLYNLAIPPRSQWSFWAGWFDNAWNGTSYYPSTLLEKIASIPNEHWEGSDAPEKIAAKIEAILGAHRLAEAINALEEQLITLAKQPIYLGNSDNHDGQHPLDDTVPIQREQLALLREKIATLKEELRKFDAPDETPDPRLIDLVAHQIWDIAKKIGFYCGQKIDIGLDAAVKTAAAAGATMGVATLTVGPTTTIETVQNVAKAAAQFAKALAGG